MAYKKFTEKEKAMFQERQKRTIEEMRGVVRTALDNFQSHPEQLAEAIAFSQKFYRYSLGNSILIQKANPHAEYVASYAGWKQLGYNVKKGAKAIKVLAPVVVTFYEDGKNSDGTPIYKRLSDLPKEERQRIDKDRLTKRVVGYKPGNVFDISGTTCPQEDYPKIFNMGYPSEMHKTLYEALKKAAEDVYGISVAEKDLESISLRGQYVPYGGANGSIETNHLLNDTQKLDTFAHEFGHALMLKYYPEESEKNISIREFEADTISLMLQSRFGIDASHSQARVDHLKKHYDNCIALGKDFNIKKFYEEVSKVYNKLINDVQPVVDQFVAAAAETERQDEAEDRAAKAKSAVENQLDEQSKKERKAEHKAAAVTAAAAVAAGAAVSSQITDEHSETVAVKKPEPIPVAISSAERTYRNCMDSLRHKLQNPPQEMKSLNSIDGYEEGLRRAMSIVSQYYHPRIAKAFGNEPAADSKAEPVPAEKAAPLADKEKSHELIGEAGLQLPGAFISHDSSLTTSISENSKNVNVPEKNVEDDTVLSDEAAQKAEPVPKKTVGNEIGPDIAKAVEVPAPLPQPQEEQQREAKRKPQKPYGSYRNSNDQYNEWRDQLVNNIDIRDVADRLGYTLTRVGNKFFSTSEHDSVRFYPNNTYVRESVPKGAAHRGGTTIDFVKNFNLDDGIGLHCADGTPVNEAKDAMKWLSENFNIQLSQGFDYSKAQSKAPKQEFKLPKKADNPVHAAAYLHKTRGIDSKTISNMLERGLLYEEDTAFHNAIFVGVNKDGERDFANHHTTLPGSKYKGDIGGSNEETGWYVANNSDKLYVSEAPIDAMSLMSVKRMDGENPDSANYLATCSTAKLNILYNRLTDDPNIKTVVFAMDKDDPGQKAIQTAVNTISAKFPNITCKQYELPDGCGKDVNDYLKYRNNRGQTNSPKKPEQQSEALTQEPVSPEI